MSSSSGGQGKDPKKPSAIIDLKATEVKADPQSTADKSATDKSATDKSGAGKPAGDKSATTASGTAQTSVPGVGAKTGTGPSASASNPGANPAKSGSDADKSAKPDAKAAATAGATAAAKSAPPSDTPPPRRSRGVAATFTHLLAGVVGGLLALFAAEPVSQSLGVSLPAFDAKPPKALLDRLAALESRQPTVPQAVSQRIDEIAGRTAAVDDLTARIADLTDRQTALDAALKSAATNTPPAAIPEQMIRRIASLEQTLETLKQAAGKDGDNGGRIAQLAALSGKLSDLEASLANQLAALREGVMKEVEGRVGPIAEASEAARSGSQRLDRELAEVKTDQARQSQQDEALKATSDRLDQAVRVVKEEIAKLSSSLDSLKGDLDQAMKSVARPADVDAALKPVAERVAAIEQNLDGMVASEAGRKANAARIVLSLELANLKRALDRGGAYTSELAAVRAFAPKSIDLAPLEAHADRGVPSTDDLLRQFRSLSYEMLEAERVDPNASVVDRLLAGARSMVKVRRTDYEPDANSTEAIIARIEGAVENGDLAAAAENAKALSEKAARPAKGWLGRVESRAAVDRAISEIEAQLKTSLSGGNIPAKVKG